MKCSAVVPWEWAFVPHRVFHEVFSSSTKQLKSSAVVPWECLMKCSAVVPWEWALVLHRVFNEVFSSSTVGMGVSPSEGVS